MKKPVTLSWSGGKDSAFALYKILQSGEFQVAGLHTVINEESKRVGMHGVDEALIEKQAEAIGLPLTKLYLENSESHQAYKNLMHDFYRQCANDHLYGIVFGDIFLEDLKRFREDLLLPSGLAGMFPLWKMNTKTLLQDFVNAGFRTLICAANAQFFTEAQMGKTIDEDFIKTLPAEIDPCGENGEFHTFVYDGPIFKKPVALKQGKIVKKTYHYRKVDGSGSAENVETAFWFQDLLSLTAR